MRTIFYARVSDKSFKTNTIENQISIIKYYYNNIDCKVHGVSSKNIFEYNDDASVQDTDAEIIVDEGYTGTNMNRPGMKYILKKVEKREIDMIMAKDISRISRNYIELGLFLKQCKINDVKLVTVIEGDYSKEEEYFMKDMKGLLADMYSKDISIKVKSSLDARKAEGIYALPLVPFGYTKVDGEIKIDKEEAKVVRYIFDIFAKENNIVRVKSKLDREGVFTPREFTYIKRLGCKVEGIITYKDMNGKNGVSMWQELNIEKRSWSYATIKKILSNEFYVGTMVYNKTIKENWSSKRRKKVCTIKRIYNHHEAIISADSFYETQRYIGIE